MVDCRGVRSPAEPGHVAEIIFICERYIRSIWTSIVLSSRIRPEHARHRHGAVRFCSQGGSDIVWQAGILTEFIHKQGGTIVVELKFGINNSHSCKSILNTTVTYMYR